MRLWGESGWCYNNNPGSSVTLNSPMFQEVNKQNCLFSPHLHLLRAHVSQLFHGSAPAGLNPESNH